MSIERDIGELKEQGRWMAQKIHQVDGKLDRIIEEQGRHAFFKGKIMGACILAGFLSSVLIEWFRR